MLLQKIFICLFIILTLGNSENEIAAETQKKSTNQLNIKQKNSPGEKLENKRNEHNATVKIIIHYDAPESINNDDVVILKGVSKGEYIEIIIEGEIFKFEHVKLGWNNKENSLIEKEIINKTDVLKNKTVILKTYIPEGIPREKIKWESREGKNYQFLIQESGTGNRTHRFNIK